MNMKKIIFALMGLLLLQLPSMASAQDEEEFFPEQGYPTLVSFKLGGGWGIGRSRQLYGYNGSSEVWWSTGEGAKINLALDLPIVPIEVVNPDSLDFGLSTTPLVGLELEAGTGYHLSTGGTTNDAISNSVFVTTKRTTAYVPVTVGLNARSSFGAGMPSVYVGVGGGVWLVAIYEEEVTNSSGGSFKRKMDPPIPFGLYGALGFEIPLAFFPEDGNSMVDMFGELRLTEMSNYIYDYQVIGNGSTTSVDSRTDPNQLYIRQSQRSASNVALTLGFKVNIY
jgi:hypothetical protein